MKHLSLTNKLICSMKKTISVLMMIILIFLFVACVPSDSDILTSSDSSSPDISNNSDIQSSLIDKEKIDELEKELNRLNTLLSTAEKEKDNLIKEMESIKTKTIYVKDEICLVLETAMQEPLVYSANVASKVSIKYTNNESAVNISDKYTTSIEISQKKDKIIMNQNYFWEAKTGIIFLYNIETRVKKELLLPGLSEQYTPAFMKWLDNRYFMFVVQLDSGTIVRGGNLYIYDTQANKSRMIIGSDDSKYQICYF